MWISTLALAAPIALPVLGAAARERPRLHAVAWTILAILGPVVLVGVFLHAADATVTTTARLEGALLATALLMLPAIAYFAIGLLAAPDWPVVTALAAALTPVVLIALVVGGVVATGLLVCGPDAYECPL